jgi:Family of unknown function (DUF6600)
VRANLTTKLILAIFFGLSCAVQTATAAVSIDRQFFHDQLAPYGNWTQHPLYGSVWHPTVVERSWRPYTCGHWVMTDEYGWLWESDFDWGWAPFHYGRWAHDEGLGWIWVPGYEWGPAWVAWRNGGGYIGWAPLPPEVKWESEVGLTFDGSNLDDFDLDVILYRPAWVFVEERLFLAPRLREVALEPAADVTLIEKTRNVTDHVTVDNRIVNRSVSVSRIEEVTGMRVARLKINEVDSLGARLARREHSNEIDLFRPRVKPSAND